MEFPITTARLLGQNIPFSGGFYARFLPYRVLAHLMRQTNALGQPVIFYLHPWELDPDHPHVPAPVPAAYRITHYHNLASMGWKLEQLLDEFHFVPLRQLAYQEAGVLPPALTA